jgi:ribosomal protein S18 acetylase RimI-like enzyme
MQLGLHALLFDGSPNHEKRMMIYLKPMTPQTFEEFKQQSQASYAGDFAKVEDISFETALKNASEQFERLVSGGLETQGQLFFDVLETATAKRLGFLWLGIQDRYGRKIASINDIMIEPSGRGRGLGKALMKLVEIESKKHGAVRVRLHVFHHNEVAKNLYTSMGFNPTSIDMRKEI